MQTALIKLDDTEEAQAAEKAAQVLRQGGVVAFPTDTVYGLGAVYSDASAVRKVFEAKGRPENKPLSILISDISQAQMLAAEIPAAAYRLMKAFWPGALTLILQKKKNALIPDEVTAGGDTIGLRMPDSSIALKIIEAADCPLAAPSANISGERSASCAGQVIEDLDGRINMIIDGGDCSIGVSSTIVDMSRNGYRILRPGSISEEEIKEKGRLDYEV